MAPELACVNADQMLKEFDARFNAAKPQL